LENAAKRGGAFLGAGVRQAAEVGGGAEGGDAALQLRRRRTEDPAGVAGDKDARLARAAERVEHRAEAGLGGVPFMGAAEGEGGMDVRHHAFVQEQAARRRLLPGALAALP